MDWIFDNLQVVIVVGSTIAWWLTQRKQGEEEEPPKHGERPGREKIDFEKLQRTKQLREEIRRKREQRRGELQPSEEPTRRSTLPDLERDITQQLPPVLREMMGIPEEAPPEPAPPPVPKVSPVSQRQQRMQDEMAALEAKRRQAEAIAAKVRVNPHAPRRRRGHRSNELNERDFLATLRDPRSARRAILLREILGKPVGLRSSR